MKTLVQNYYGQLTTINLNSIPPTGTLIKLHFPTEAYALTYKVIEVLLICSEDSSEMELTVEQFD